ncbi:MAG: PKD domain-containing protein [Oligoflexia bacterium]|nr:PKD domain-containing protein [Oligoflexia bacterium]
MNLKSFSRFLFLIYFPLIFTSCSGDNLLSGFSLNSVSSIQSQAGRSESDSEEEPELRFSFQMTPATPTAVLSEDKVVKVGSQVSIDGSMSSGGNLSYRWSFDVFPVSSNAKIDDPTASSISFTPDVPGLYLVKLIVRDTNTNSKASYLAVRATEDNSPPSFRISLIGSWNEGFPQQVRIRLRDITDDEEVRFIEVDYGDGNQTVFYDKEIEEIDGNLEHHYLKEGSYEVKVSMIDNEGARTTKTAMVNLRQNSKIPVLKYSVNSVSGTAPFTLRIDASASFDPDNNNPLHFFWDWDDEGAFTYTEDIVSTHTYTKPGIYQVTPFTSDRGAGERYNEFTVYVDDPNDPGAYKAPAGGSPPVLNLVGTNDFYSGQAPLTVNFDASQSFDLEGDSFEVFWSFDGFTFKQFDEGLKVSRTYDNPGRYSVLVGLRDSHGNEFMRYIDVYVYDPLVEEQPRFTARQRTDNPQEIKFNAGIRELYGVPALYSFWDLGNGDFSRRYNPDYTYSKNGTYPVTLTTVDIFGNRKSVSKILNVDGEKHLIEDIVEPFYQVAQVGSSVSFSGARSSSAVSGMLDFFWYLVTGVRKAVSSLSYSYSKRGVYKNYMTVTNQYGFSKSAQSWVTVNSGAGPKAGAKFSTYIGSAPLTVNFDGSYSQSPASITDYDWNLGNYDDIDRSFTGSNVSYTYKEPGEMYQLLFIKDSNGNLDVAFYQVTVLDPSDVSPTNQSPSVSINTNAISINNLTLNMESTLSDPDGHIRYTEWDWGDRGIDVFSHSESSPSHTYESYGSYTVTVRVFDNMGAIATASHDITLTQPTPQNSARSAPVGFEGQEQTQRVSIPKKHFSSQDRFEEDRQKDGCYRKDDGQMRCYSSEYKERGM